IAAAGVCRTISAGTHRAFARGMTGDPSDVRAEWRAMVASPLDLSEFPPASTHTIEVAGLSMCGRLQHANTDHFLAIRLGRLQETVATSLSAGDLPPRFEEHAYAMLVADGLGGHGTGARASRLALSTLAHLAIRYGKWNVRMGADTAADIAEQGEFFYRQITDAMSQAAPADFRLPEMAAGLAAQPRRGVPAARRPGADERGDRQRDGPGRRLPDGAGAGADGGRLVIAAARHGADIVAPGSGTAASICVPPPGFHVIEKVPFIFATRSRIVMTHSCAPWPLSVENACPNARTLR